MPHSHDFEYDVIIIGTGAAGLGVALTLAPTTRVLLISKNQLSTGASPWAQGGIAAVMDQDSDSIESHIQDTLIAGAGLCDEKAVRFTVENAQTAIHWLIANGVQFTRHDNNQTYHLTKEGGHSHRRILHAADKTGNEVIRSLSQQVKDKKNITILTEHTAIDLMINNGQCVGVSVLENKTKIIKTFFSQYIVLATGGASSIYPHTSNPDQSTGDGIAIAYRVGAVVTHLEFNQFHPTCLYHEAGEPFLISEAVRGEGGILRLANGYAFMQDYDQRKELAPRDVVARAIDDIMKKNHLKHVYLDVTHLSADKIKSHFPTIYQHCLTLDIDMTKDLIPVVPAAHYTCGGVNTDLLGQTNIPHLFAVGEVAYTGLHGANRLASNSLLECLVFAASCAKSINHSLVTNKNEATKNTRHKLNQIKANQITSPTEKHKSTTKTEARIKHLRAEIQTIMSQHVGIVRETNSLKIAHQSLMHLSPEISTLYKTQAITKELITLRNLHQLALLTVEQALARKTSIGLHFNKDYLTSSNII